MAQRAGYLLLVGGVRDRLVPASLAQPGRLILADDLFSSSPGSSLSTNSRSQPPRPYQNEPRPLQARSADQQPQQRRRCQGVILACMIGASSRNRTQARGASGVWLVVVDDCGVTGDELVSQQRGSVERSSSVSMSRPRCCPSVVCGGAPAVRVPGGQRPSPRIRSLRCGRCQVPRCRNDPLNVCHSGSPGGILPVSVMDDRATL